MVLSSSPLAPVVVVVGITGQQGGSVARALIASDKPYRIIGLTRDATRPSAKQWLDLGIELRQVAISVGNEDAVLKAFEGADILFAVTNFDEHGDKQREIAEGKIMVDSAVAVKVTLYLWSSLEPIGARTNGRYPGCDFFDAKGEITSYLATRGLHWANVPCGFYSSNLTKSSYAPVQDAEGTYVLRLPVRGSTKVPVLDPVKDYGSYVVRAIEGEGMGPGSEVLSGRLTSFDEIVDGLSKASGKKVVFRQVDKQTFLDDVLGPRQIGAFAPMVYDMFAFIEELGYYGGKDVEASQAAAGIVPRRWDEILSTTEGPLIR